MCVCVYILTPVTPFIPRVLWLPQDMIQKRSQFQYINIDLHMLLLVLSITLNHLLYLHLVEVIDFFVLSSPEAYEYI